MSAHTFNVGYAKYLVNAVPGESIIVQREGHEPTAFEIGDPAEYDSYNLKYTGKIVSITDKTVTILPKYENRKRRLKIEDFAWRNYDFNAERVAAENYETSHYI
jgi:hypothetical protein